MDDEVLIVGSGPAGLSCAAELLARGVSATVLERGPTLAAEWESRYDGMRFNTSRRFSSLPGHPFAREWGNFPTRDQYLSYLGAYADRHQIPVRTGVSVSRLDPAADGWVIQTSAGPARAAHAIVAMGLANTPTVPAWSVDSPFAGQVLHARAYRNPERFTGQVVLVVGSGSTGMEVAYQLACGGAERVYLSFRTPPNILYRMMAGAPADLPVPILLRLPDPVVDRFTASLQRHVVGDLTAYGLPPAPEGSITALKRRGAGTAVVDREVVDAIRDGTITVLPEVVGLTREGARVVDGRQVNCSVVLLATGYRTGLQPVVGHLGVLAEREMPAVTSGAEALPGLRFVGYLYRPGLTGYVGHQARRVAREIAARPRAGRPARAGWRPRAWRRSTSRVRAASPG